MPAKYRKRALPTNMQRAGPVATMFKASRLVPWNSLRNKVQTGIKRYREVKKQFDPKKKQKKDNKKPVSRSFINAHVTTSYTSKLNKLSSQAKTYKKLSHLSTYGLEALSGTQCSVGTQFASQVYHGFTADNLLALNDTVTNNITITADSQVRKLHVKDCTITTTFTNQGTTNTVLYIMDVCSKVDDGTLRDPTTNWTAGYAEELFNMVAYANAINTVGNKPSDVTNFKTLWTTHGIHKLIIGPGQNHIHKYYFGLNKVLPTNRWSDIEMLRGITNACIVWGHGTPVDDSNVRATIGNVQTAACKIIWHTQIRLRGSALSRYQPPKIFRVGSSMPSASANLYQIDDDDGDVEQIRVAGVDTGFA